MSNGAGTRNIFAITVLALGRLLALARLTKWEYKIL
jgi:hypothetical protein